MIKINNLQDLLDCLNLKIEDVTKMGDRANTYYEEVLSSFERNIYLTCSTVVRVVNRAELVLDIPPKLIEISIVRKILVNQFEKNLLEVYPF